MPRRHPSRPSRSQSTGTDPGVSSTKALLFANSCSSLRASFAVGASTENEIRDLHRSGLLAGPPNGYCGRISPQESGARQPQTEGNLDTKKMDCGSQASNAIRRSLESA
jgi:hypothetical protein